MAQEAAAETDKEDKLEAKVCKNLAPLYRKIRFTKIEIMKWKMEASLAEDEEKAALKSKVSKLVKKLKGLFAFLAKGVSAV